MERATTRLGAKGRVLLPTAVRRAAGLEEGDDVVAFVEGPGRVVLETAEAVQARVWRHAPASGIGQTAVSSDDDVRAIRDDDVALADAAAARSAERGAAGSGSRQDPGPALLAELGL